MSLDEKELKMVFDAFDEDKSGEISKAELTKLLSEVWKDDAKAKKGTDYMLKLFDSDGNKQISWMEFKEGVIKYLGEEEEQKKQEK